ncbi:MAG TPA: LysR substrate-binding domain-containing protein [Casimicrobiaceae bacterium]|nr:LysR substrate-binding domain-containing protein [Casimicrobiaceae bacterium]
MKIDLSNRIVRRFTLHDLDVLLAVAAERSMGKAAARLHTSQPAISRTIAELERTLGVPLFDRNRGGVALTRYGSALAECSAEVFDDLRRGINRIEWLTDPARGEVIVGCNPVLAASFVAAVIEAVTSRYPGITFRLIVGPSKELRQRLHEREVDILVTRDLAEDDDRSLTTERLFDDSFVVAVGAGNPLARQRRLGLRNLERYCWVLPPSESLIGQLAHNAFVTEGLAPPRVAVTAIPLDTRLSLLATGRFVTILPLSALRLPRPRGDVQRLFIPLRPRVPNVLLTIRDRASAPQVQTFRQVALGVARKYARQISRAN